MEKKTILCGTLNPKRRGLPPQLKEKVSKSQSRGFKCQHGTRVIKWHDKRSVIMLTTSPTQSSTLVDSGRKNRRNELVRKPQPVLDYNKAKKGVDYSDQMASYNTSLRKTIKWYKKAVVEILTGTAKVNSWIVYCKASGNKIPIIKFWEIIAKQLLETNDGIPNIVSPNLNRKKAHTLLRKDGPARKAKRRYVECYKKNRANKMSSKEAGKATKQVNTYCRDCNGEPHMCLNCFNTKHNN